MGKQNTKNTWSLNRIYIGILLVVFMAHKKIIRKVFVNKRNKQLSVPLSKKEIKAVNPTIKFSDNLFVKITIFNKKKK